MPIKLRFHKFIKLSCSNPKVVTKDIMLTKFTGFCNVITNGKFIRNKKHTVHLVEIFLRLITLLFRLRFVASQT